MPSNILDWTGRPATYMGGSGASGVLYARAPEDERLRPRQPNHFDDYLYLLGTWPWQRLVSESRAIGSRGLVAAALLQKADYVSSTDWRTYFAGEDSAYGDATDEVLESTNHLVCTRGPRYDWATIWKLGVLSVGCDGGFFLLLTKSAEGWPMFQPLEAHRIGQRDWGEQEVQAGSAFTRIPPGPDLDGEPATISTPYVGLRIVNGIIYNRAGCEVAYRVLGATPELDEDISARDMIHVGPPRWFSEGRPAPQIAPGFLSLLAVDLASSAQLDQQIIHSRLTVINSNETGRQDPVKTLLNQNGPGPGPMVGSANLDPEMVTRGQFSYIKNGNGLKPFESKNPSDQWMNFDSRSAKRAVAASGWRLEMLDPEALGSGGPTRAFADQINTQIQATFKTFYHAVLRADRYRVACLTQIGVLPDHPEFIKRGVTPPADFSVDRASLQWELELVRAGAQSMPDVMRKLGLRPRPTVVAQARHESMKDALARKYGVESGRLGTLSKPGDIDRLASLGTAVRAGVITPSPEIEEYMRNMMDIPAMSPATKAAWAADGIRKPVTLANAANEKAAPAVDPAAAPDASPDAQP